MATLREIKRISEAHYRERNREKIKERLRLWEEQNKEKRKAYFKEKHREYYLKKHVITQTFVLCGLLTICVRAVLV